MPSAPATWAMWQSAVPGAAGRRGPAPQEHVDCGSLLYDAEGQSVHSGASGPGCCAAVLCGHLLPRLERRGQRRVLFLATGALMSQTTFLQKESIPAISHLVELAAPEEQNGGNT